MLVPSGGLRRFALQKSCPNPSLLGQVLAQAGSPPLRLFLAKIRLHK